MGRMIALDLECTQGHRFEGWFDDLAAFETQQKKALIACPVCNSSAVCRIPSTFAIKASPPPPANRPARAKLALDAGLVHRKIVDFINKNFDDVGADFSKEALKIHYGATEPRNIRGVSSGEEEKTLEKEGVSFFKIPLPEPSPETDN
jgi:hypothetical protein